MPAFTLAASLILGQMVSTTPAHRMGEQWWKERHERCVEATKKGDLDVIFIGDSITQGWEGGGKAAWDKYFGEYKTGNFGFSGDRTEHVLWRMDNGEIVGLQPKVAVMMIGTNNIGHGSSNPEQTAEGVKAIVAKLRAKLPKTKILLLGIFPRGATSEDRMRQGTVAATEGFKGIADGKMVHFQDVGQFFMSRDGVLWKSLMPDLLHLTPDGYDIWGKAIAPTLKKLTGEDCDCCKK